MSSRAVITTVIPCYEQARFLDGALRSVLAQSVEPIQILVIDDDSTDDPLSVCRSFGPAVEYVHQPHGGLSAARNLGLSLARGEFVHFLDADDAICDSFYAKALAAFEENREALLVAGTGLFCTPALEPFGPEMVPPATGCWFDQLARRNPLHVGAVVCRREVIDPLGGFDSTIDGCADWDMWGRIARLGGSMVRLDSAHSYYRQHPRAMSQGTLKMYQAAETVLCRMHAPDTRVTSPAPALRRGADEVQLVDSLYRHALAYFARAACGGDLSGAKALFAIAGQLRPAGPNDSDLEAVRNQLTVSLLMRGFSADRGSAAVSSVFSQLMQDPSLPSHDRKALLAVSSDLACPESRSEIRYWRERYHRLAGSPLVRVMLRANRVLSTLRSRLASARSRTQAAPRQGGGSPP